MSLRLTERKKILLTTLGQAVSYWGPYFWLILGFSLFSHYGRERPEVSMTTAGSGIDFPVRKNV